MNSYEAKQEARRERLEAAADRAEAKARAAYKRADMSEEATGIPFGQPVLVGHYSERRHRKAIERADNAMRQSIAESNRAGELRARADGVGSGGISSDDPEAVDKLREKLSKLEAQQTFMAAANKVIRKAAKAGVKDAESEGWDAYVMALATAHGGASFPISAAVRLLQPDFCGRIGFASYQLSNNNANIRRIKERIAYLEREQAARPEEDKVAEVNGVRVVENADENRLQLFFPGKPSAEVRGQLKSAGFRWAPSAGAWQRQLNNGARYAAERVLAALP